MAQAVRTETHGAILEVTLARGKANAIDTATSRELAAVFATLRDDPDLRVAILTGAGERFFSAGWDLKAAAAGEGGAPPGGPAPRGASVRRAGGTSLEDPCAPCSPSSAA
jgi:crotonobetainyl-CoA hydratase